MEWAFYQPYTGNRLSQPAPAVSHTDTDAVRCGWKQRYTWAEDDGSTAEFWTLSIHRRTSSRELPQAAVAGDETERFTLTTEQSQQQQLQLHGLYISRSILAGTQLRTKRFLWNKASLPMDNSLLMASRSLGSVRRCASFLLNVLATSSPQSMQASSMLPFVTFSVSNQFLKFFQCDDLCVR